MNRKYIFIVNGYPRSGKTTFGRILNNYVPCTHISIIDPIKNLAEIIGWDSNHKTEKDRKFLSDLKDLCNEYNDFALNRVIETICRFLLHDENPVLLIDMREPEDIRRIKEIFQISTIFIDRPDADHIITNHADANVEYVSYNIIIPNKGTMEDFENEIEKFAKDNLEYAYPIPDEKGK